MTRQLMRLWFSKLPPYERDLPLLTVQDKTYTPRQAVAEVEKATHVGAELQRLVETLSLGLVDEYALAKRRLLEMLATLPEKPLVGTLLIPERTFTPSQLASEIRRETALGKQWIRNETFHMKRVLGLR